MIGGKGILKPGCGTKTRTVNDSTNDVLHASSVSLLETAGRRWWWWPSETWESRNRSRLWDFFGTKGDKQGYPSMPAWTCVERQQAGGSRTSLFARGGSTYGFHSRHIVAERRRSGLPIVCFPEARMRQWSSNE